MNCLKMGNDYSFQFAFAIIRIAFFLMFLIDLNDLCVSNPTVVVHRSDVDKLKYNAKFALSHCLAHIKTVQILNIFILKFFICLSHLRLFVH